jgi:hypothetical protein
MMGKKEVERKNEERKVREEGRGRRKRKKE